MGHTVRHPFNPLSLHVSQGPTDRARAADPHLIADLHVGVRTAIRTLDVADGPLATEVDPLIEPSPKNWHDHCRQIERHCRIHR